MDKSNRSRNYSKENEKTPEWKKRFYGSRRWAECRRYIMSRDMRLCQDCRKEGKVTAATEVHHITPVTEANVNDDRITVNPSNLVALCHKCHEKRHTQKRYTVDRYGRVSPF